jgi:hypothetical protein
MARKSKQKLHGIAEPMLGREPLFIRLCSAFVDNPALILRRTTTIVSMSRPLSTRDLKPIRMTLDTSLTTHRLCSQAWITSSTIAASARRYFR